MGRFVIKLVELVNNALTPHTAAAQILPRHIFAIAMVLARYKLNYVEEETNQMKEMFLL